MIVRHVSRWIALAVLLAASAVHGVRQQSTGEVLDVADGVQHQQWTSGLGGDLTAEQRALLLQLQTETGLRGAQRKLQNTKAESFPPGVAGFEAPKGVEVPVVPFMGSPDQPSIDVFSWLIAAKMEGGHAVVQQPVEVWCHTAHSSDGSSSSSSNSSQPA
jgi:hypothetical protein